MIWNVEEGEQAEDILHARLRAKYYGAKMITCRPFVLKILDLSSPHSDSEEQASNDYKSSVDVPKIDPNAKSIRDIDRNALEYARQGLKALQHSTTAFHSLGKPGEVRLIVTNVWGTAHA